MIKWSILRRTVVFRPFVATTIAIILTYFLSSDVNADMFLSTVCGSSDIEVSDFYNRVRAGSSRKNIDNQMLIVNIDSVFDRGELAMMINEISENSPKAICLDVLFDEAKDPETDKILSETFKDTPNLVVSQKYNDYDLSPAYDFTSEFAPSVKRGMANLTAATHHGIVREVTPFFGKNNEYPSLAASLLEEIAPTQYSHLEKRSGDEMIRFQPEEFYVMDPYEAWDDPSIFKDKIVFLGTINEQADLHRTPLSEDYPGVMIQANILSMMLHDDYVNPNSDIYNFLLSLISCILVTVLYVVLDSSQNFVMRVFPMVWMVIVVILGCWSFNNWGIYLNAPQTIILAALSLVVLDTWYAFEDPVKRIYNKIFLKEKQLKEIDLL